MRRALVLCLLALLVPGCMQDDPGLDDLQDGTAADAARVSDQPTRVTSGSHLAFNTSTSSVVTAAFVGGGNGAGLAGSNCLHIPDSVTVIHSGWVEAVWQATTPDLGMELRAATDPPLVASGMSPLRLDLTDVHPDSFFEDYSIALMPLAGTGAFADLQLTFNVVLLDYSGPAEPRIQHAGSCAFG